MDDLQWADKASLSLLKTILTDNAIHHLLVIGAFRDNEVDEAHPLHQFIKEIKEAGSPVPTLNLSPLSIDDINALLTDATGATDDKARRLSDLATGKPQGIRFSSSSS